MAEINIIDDKEKNIFIQFEKETTIITILEELVENISKVEKIVEELSSKNVVIPTIENVINGETNNEEKINIIFTVREYDKKEQKLINSILENNKINIDIKYENERESLGLYNIKETYDKSIDISDTKYIKGSLRSGMREEYKGSIVILGDLNSGAEAIATGNVVITGKLRGLAHAGAEGNTAAFISANSTVRTQIRIANEVQEIDEQLKNPIFYIENGKIKFSSKKENTTLR